MVSSEGELAALSIKAVILGEPGVGKKCIENSLVNNDYRECVPTTGASYSKKVIFYPNFNQSIKFDIWDTAGQEKYRSMNNFLNKDAKVALLVYDITRKSSLEEIKKYLVDQLKEHASKDISK